MPNLFSQTINRSFKTQLIYSFTAVLILLIVTYTYIITSYQSNFLKESAIKQAQNRSLSLAKSSKIWIMANDYIGLDEVIQNYSLYDDLIFAAILNADAKVIAHTNRDLVGKYIADKRRISYIKHIEKSSSHDDHQKIIFQSDAYIDIIQPIHHKEEHLAFIHMRLDQTQRKAAIHATIKKGVYFTIFSILLGVLFAYLLAEGLTNRLSRLINSVQKFKLGKRSEQADEDGVIEISELSHEFNDLVDTLNKTEDLNQQLTERLELAFFATQDGLWDWNIKQDSIYYSPIWKNMIGYEDNEFSNDINNWESRVHPDDLKKVLFDIQEHIDAKTDKYYNIHRLLHKDGRWIWTLDRGKALYDKNGKAVRMVGTHTDITKHKAKELIYAQQAQIMSQVHDSVISTDIQGNITSWNLGSQKMLGYTQEEVMGKPMSIIHRDEDIHKYQSYALELLEKNSLNVEAFLLTKSKNAVPVSVSLSVLRDENFNPIGMIGVSQDISERRTVEEELIKQKNILEHQAHHDALTGLPNRLLFFDRLTQSTQKAMRNSKKLAIFFIDLDRFKQINDSLGHDYGDEVLQIVSSRLLGIIRKEDTLARLGGDEFTILIEDLEKECNVSSLAKKILDALIKPMEINHNTLYISSSIGISLYPKDDRDPINLLKYADAAMYKAKDEGRNNFKYYSAEMTQKALDYVKLESNIRAALKNEEFVVYYQPQIDASSETITGMEALVRWNSPKEGLISPAKFIPLAEETGLIVELDRWVMKTAIKQIVKWHKQGLSPGKVSINLSIKQLHSTDFLQVLQKILDDNNCLAKWIELEVTEGQIMTNPEEAISILHKLHDIGIELAIDDFGTGYSSLSYLKRLPIDKLKIDQSFIKDLPNDDEDASITKAIIALSDSLGLSVIAEGVETQEQKDFLLQNGCKNIQGYLYSRPLPTHDMQKMLSSGVTNL
ncbi:MAG: GGDEF domain-containing protein [Epsilonproteobacteria bacterium]|nr:MAG: GGDEF domain-containing protein [Campylobacterota bacterium]